MQHTEPEKTAVLPAAPVAPDPFAGIQPDPVRLRAFLRCPAPALRYAIFFTPRSSSTRLGRALMSTGRMGHPREWFNPAFLPRAAGKVGANRLSDYVEATVRRNQREGIFGVELTWRHLRAVFGTGQEFLSLVRPDHLIWLIRHDIVAQAVSLTRIADERGVAHAAIATPEQLARAEDNFSYDRNAIRGMIANLAQQEIRTGQFLAGNRLQALRLSYEQLSGLRDDAIVALVARHLGLPVPEVAPDVSGHVKLPGDRAAEYAERFRSEEADFLAGIEEARARLRAGFPA